MCKSKIVLLALSILGMIVSVAEAATVTDHRKRYYELGGVNLDNWCKHTFGQNFFAKVDPAGVWKCRAKRPTASYPKPISVEGACRLQHGDDSLKAKVVNGSWVCLKPI